jgi:hypothetical protein
MARFSGVYPKPRRDGAADPSLPVLSNLASLLRRCEETIAPAGDPPNSPTASRFRSLWMREPNSVPIGTSDTHSRRTRRSGDARQLLCLDAEPLGPVRSLTSCDVTSASKAAALRGSNSEASPLLLVRCESLRRLGPASSSPGWSTLRLRCWISANARLSRAAGSRVARLLISRPLRLPDAARG